MVVLCVGLDLDCIDPGQNRIMQDPNYWKDVFKEAAAEAKRIDRMNMLTVVAAVALVFGLIVGVFLIILK